MANLENRNEVNLGTPISGAFSGDWTRDRGWWRDNFMSRPYATADRTFEDYEPGYRYAYESYPRYKGRKFSDVEPDLRTGFTKFEGRGRSTWENVRESVRDAWDKLTGRESRI
jgi:hypothetical protein